MWHKRHINEMLHTEFVNSGRAAGIGITYDRYDEDSGYMPQPKFCGTVRFPSDKLKPEEISALSGPVIIYKKEEA